MRSFRRLYVFGGLGLLALASALGFSAPAGAQNSTPAACPAGFAPVEAAPGKAFVPVAAGVPAGCFNVSCPSHLIAQSPYADGSSPVLAGAAAAGSSLDGCVARQSAVAPIVTVKGNTQTNPTSPVNPSNPVVLPGQTQSTPSGNAGNNTQVGGVVLTSTDNNQGGIRGSLLARTGTDSNKTLQNGAALLVLGAVLTGVSVVRRRRLSAAAIEPSAPASV